MAGHGKAQRTASAAGARSGQAWSGGIVGFDHYQTLHCQTVHGST